MELQLLHGHILCINITYEAHLYMFVPVIYPTIASDIAVIFYQLKSLLNIQFQLLYLSRWLFLYDFPLFDGQARVKTRFPTFDLKLIVTSTVCSLVSRFPPALCMILFMLVIYMDSLCNQIFFYAIGEFFWQLLVLWLSNVFVSHAFHLYLS
jgi:hypothetical protein